jgi:membrane protease YdiL (CAAX protease family)
VRDAWLGVAFLVIWWVVVFAVPRIASMPILAQLPSPFSFLMAGVIVAPLVEELFFRGFVFSGLRTRYGWPKAATLSSLLFTVFHLQPLAIPPMLLLGYFVALLYQRSRSLWPSILMHMLMNALAPGVAYLATRIGIPREANPTDFFSTLPTSPIGGSPLPTVAP